MSRIAINGMGWRDRAVDIVLECMGSYRDIVGVSDEAIVSTDIIHAPPGVDHRLHPDSGHRR